MCRRKPDRRAGYQAAQEMKQDLGDDHVCPQAIHLYPVRSHHLRYAPGSSRGRSLHPDRQARAARRASHAYHADTAVAGLR